MSGRDAKVSIRDVRRFVHKQMNRIGGKGRSRNQDREVNAQLRAYQNILKLCNKVEIGLVGDQLLEEADYESQSTDEWDTVFDTAMGTNHPLH